MSFESPNRLNTSEKPYVKFQVEQRWIRKDKEGKPNISVLFIAESPPWNGKQNYFYNPDTPKKRSGLRVEVFKRLNIDSLKQFKSNGYFLIDSIKCRLKKRAIINVKEKSLPVPQKALKTCSEQFLRREIKELKPKIIFVLGGSAKKALQQYSEFRKLQFHSVTEKDDFDEELSKYRVILCPFPSRWNLLRYKDKINRAFSKIV